MSRQTQQEDDLFACFGSDDDDDDDDDDCVNNDIVDVNNSSSVDEYDVDHDDDRLLTRENDRERALHLMDTYNGRVSHSSSNHKSTPIIASSPSFTSTYDDQRFRTSLLPWPDQPPLYIGPIHLETDSKKGRGYVATYDLPPGTCILVETPFISGWSAHQTGQVLGLESVKYIFEQQQQEKTNINEIIKCMEELHPRKEIVDKYLPLLLPLFHEGSAGTVSNSNNDDKNEKPTIEMDPIDEIQIVDMMSEVMMSSSINNYTTLTNERSHDVTNTDPHPNNDNCQRTMVQEEVQSLVAYAAQHNIHNSDGSPIHGIDVVRLLLTLRYNGFDSGLYLHFSMFNHGEDPNCIKFRPESTSCHNNNKGRIAMEENKDRRSSDSTAHYYHYYSEARTTRYVRRGESLTLHYLENPRDVSHSTRRRQLWDQHRFDIGGNGRSYGQYLDEEAGCDMQTLKEEDDAVMLHDTTRGRNIFDSELIHGRFPNSALLIGKRERTTVDGDCTRDKAITSTLKIEKSLDELEDILRDLQANLSSIQSSGKNVSQDRTMVSSVNDYYFDQAAALELTIGELITASISILGNDHHILLARCRRLHIDVIEILLAMNRLSERQSNELMGRFIVSVQHLLISQRRRLGSEHIDVARTYYDYSMGIQALLMHAPRRLLLLDVVNDEDVVELGEKAKLMTTSCGKNKSKNNNRRWTLNQWSKIEHKCRMLKSKIEEMYPKDVDAILESVKKKEH